MGLNAYTGEVEDMYKLGVVEPLRVKIQAILSATDAACLILRIDDVLASTKKPPGAAGRGGCRQEWAAWAEWDGLCRQVMGGMPPGCSRQPESLLFILFSILSI